MGGIMEFISVFVVRLGASSLLVSLLTSLPALLGVLLSIPAGIYVARQPDPVRLTNKWRLFHRSTFFLIALLPFFFQRNLAVMVVAFWALEAVPAAVINLSWTAVVAEIVPPRRRPTVNGLRWSLLSTVIAISVAVFGYLLERLPFPWGYQLVFTISFIGGLISIYFFSHLQIPSSSRPPTHPTPAAQPSKRSWSGSMLARLSQYGRSLGQEPLFVRYLITTFVLRIGLNLPAALYSIYRVRYLQATDSLLGWQATARSLALIVGYFLWGKIAGRCGHHRVLLICTLGVGLYPFLLTLIPDPIWLPLIAVVYGFFVTGIDLSFFDTLLQVCPAERRSPFIALNTVLANIVIFAAPMLGSLLSEQFDIRQVFWLAALVHLIAAGGFAWLRIGAEEAH